MVLDGNPVSFMGRRIGHDQNYWRVSIEPVLKIIRIAPIVETLFGRICYRSYDFALGQQM
jgi:hypothetical protein